MTKRFYKTAAEIVFRNEAGTGTSIPASVKIETLRSVALGAMLFGGAAAQARTSPTEDMTPNHTEANTPEPQDQGTNTKTQDANQLPDHAEGMHAPSEQHPSADMAKDKQDQDTKQHAGQTPDKHAQTSTPTASPHDPPAAQSAETATTASGSLEPIKSPDFNFRQGYDTSRKESPQPLDVASDGPGMQRPEQPTFWQESTMADTSRTEGDMTPQLDMVRDTAQSQPLQIIDGCGCPCCNWNGEAGVDGTASSPSFPVNDSDFDPTDTGTLQDIADYLTTGYWEDTGRGGRSFNVKSSGDLPNSGVLYYNMTETPSLELNSNRTREDSDGVPTHLHEDIRDAFDLYEEILGINFVETTSTSGVVDIFFGDAYSGNFANVKTFNATSGPVDFAYINLPGTSSGPGDNYNTTIIHEIGHALGLGHAGDYNGSGNTYANNANFTNDSDQLSLMSYWTQGTNPNVIADTAAPTTLQAADLLALDDLYDHQGYGTSNAFNGNTIYGVGTNITTAVSAYYANLDTLADTNAFTIVDGSGYDIINFSNFSDDQAIDLRAPGPSTIISGAGFGTDIGVSIVGGLTGNMLISAGTVIEAAETGSGNDTIIGNGAANRLTGNDGDDSLVGGAGNDRIYGGSGSDTMRGGTGNDSIYGGGGGSDRFYGDAGNDDFFINSFHTGPSVNIYMNGGTGTDQLRLVGSGTFDLTGLNVISVEEIIFNNSFDTTLILSNKELDSPTEFQNVVIDGFLGASSENDVIVNTDFTDDVDLSGWTFRDWQALYDSITINGNANNNEITGTSQNDTINAFEGQDTVYAGAGDDVIIDTENASSANADTYDGGSGTDTMVAERNWAGSVVFDLLNGVQTVSGITRDTYVSIENLTISGHADIIGSNDDNLLIANDSVFDGDNDIDGRGGDDTIYGGGGNDTLRGGSGVDSLYGEDGDDNLGFDAATMGAGNLFDGGDGNDDFTFAEFASNYVVDLGVGTFERASGTGLNTLVSIENVYAGAGDDVLTGSTDDNVLDGGDGNDTIRGGTGADEMYGGLGDDDLGFDPGNLRAGNLFDGGEGTCHVPEVGMDFS